LEEIRKTFAHQIDDMKKSVIEMGSMAEELIEGAVKALIERDTALAESIISADEQIDRKELEIEALCLKLLALQQPLAIDLRMISGVMRIIADIERLADHTTKISKKAIALSSLPLLKPYVDLPIMSSKVIEMLKMSIDAFINLDTQKALRIIDMDDEIDDFNHKIFKELVSIMNKDASSINYVSHLMSVVASVERIGDHVVNICERIIFIQTGAVPQKS